MLERETEAQVRARKVAEKDALEYPHQPPQDSGEVVEVADGVYWARIAMPMALDHINVYLLADDDGWYLVDTGLNTQASRDSWQALSERHFSGKPLKGIICTHFHYDHAGLASWLMKEFSAPLYMTHGEYFTMRALASSDTTIKEDSQREFFLRTGMPLERFERMLGSHRRDPFIPEFPASFIRLRDGDELTIKGRQWRVVVGEGHSPEHACLYAEDDRILLAGDQVLPGISSNVLVSDVEPEADPLKLWMSSLDRLKTLAEDTLVLPAHGLVFRGLHTRVDQLHAHHQRQLDVLMGPARQGESFTAWEAMSWLFTRELNSIELMLAQGETLAHLNYLCRTGQLLRQRGEDGMDRYCAQ
ncbi:MBL fold metallo-hydrolase [Marinobacterium sediminicola]|uniref:Glyoxylase, beta-lactamase superfamily II n=1 Tax=Marinobacterium sediminicola TaxID=518898 RepID=A0ABY1S4P9_9GAMM|nr:MBL fold metallo-hydrolase [Marinobacterium sediminicola]ULG70138.1 MBL fold metallo-hydrolase [Marinobacterium sediminicola]SMR78413.1 Glyoxylase, beta-lactamase superfamily II [Marinobacterium sediminicola]